MKNIAMQQLAHRTGGSGLYPELCILGLRSEVLLLRTPPQRGVSQSSMVRNSGTRSRARENRSCSSPVVREHHTAISTLTSPLWLIRTGSSTLTPSDAVSPTAQKSPSEYTFERDVEDIEGIRKALNLGQINVLGHSYGGMVAQAYALKYPDSVKRLILANTLFSGRDVASE